MDQITPQYDVKVLDGPLYEGPLNIPMASLDAFSQKLANQCRYIESKEPAPLYLCCARETDPGRPYCAYHFALTRRPSEPRRIR